MGRTFQIAATFNNNAAGTLSGELQNLSGTTTNAGQLNGGVAVSGGTVRNSLDAAQPPAPGEDAVEVRARSSFGDITIRRARSPAFEMATASG